jgi:NitT/TauT family transport system substrate-binding protein
MMTTSNGRTRRRVLAQALAAGTIAAASGKGARAQAPATRPFTIGIADPVNTVLAMWMAQGSGAYERAGLATRFLDMHGGSRGAEALRDGQIDVMHVGLSSVIKLNEAGADLRIIGSLSNVIRFQFFGAPGVTTAADLKGGVIGVSSLGSESDSTVTLALRQLGLSRDDVQIKAIGGGVARLQAVKSGAVRATALNEPFSTFARDQGVRILVDLVSQHIPWLFSGIVVRQAALASDREKLLRFLRATIEGDAVALANPTEAKRELALELKLKEPKIVDISYEDFRQQSPPDLEPTEAAAKNVLALFPGAGQPSAYINDSLIAQLRRDGSIAAIRKKYAAPG